MKKYGYLFLIQFVFFANSYGLSSTVNLPSGGDVQPTEAMNVSVKGLVPSAVYNVICYINANYAFEVVRLTTDFGDSTGKITSITLNGDTVVQGQLTIGQNVAVFTGSFDNPSASSVVFTNLDQDYPFTVSNCHATAVVG